MNKPNGVGGITDVLGKVPGRASRYAVAQAPMSLVLTDPHRADNPIIYVNRAFEVMTGYSLSYVLGRNCRFLQRDGAEEEATKRLRAAIDKREPVQVDITNYRFDGSAFTNRLSVSPIYDSNNDLYAFVGIQTEITAENKQVEELKTVISETQHRVRNHLQLISSMIRLRSQESPDGAFEILAKRVEALGLLYDEFFVKGGLKDDSLRFDIVSGGAYVSRVATLIASLDMRRTIRMNVDVDPIYIETERAAQLGLIVSELITNALQHAFPDRSEGVVEVRLKELGGDQVRLTVADDGVGMGAADWPNGTSLGSRICKALIGQIDGNLNVATSEAGSIVTVDFYNATDTTLDQTGQRREIQDSNTQRLT
ncbi:sensory box histidine kinase [Parvularcula bermudensis HTCC2503]|uniref:Sensory box histidine kinase n=1 Tax=Parvularcula bermudensis (strain ATCC BAA-594 / HTCC2503 / KCTC 12087) TaxID=314260 RepID=E0TE19_PARBH|nr:PAS domain-containing protein [Parvularcula bermudensis]ADM08840.1 sensory box histidine kinase [Parvularcula bermudensis HTCC2503]